MAKNKGMGNAKTTSAQAVEERAARVAQALSMELVEVAVQKESRGKCLCIYVDKDGGVSLDDCERYHKQIQPLLEDVDYDFLEVSSPGIDRPIKTMRDFEKNRAGGGKAVCGLGRQQALPWTFARYERGYGRH